MSKFLLFVSALCCTLYAYASDFMVDGLNYTILSDNEVEVSGFSSASIRSPMYKSEILEIPSEVTNKGITYIVTSIGYSAFSVARSGNAYMGNFNKIVIPSSIKTIGDYAFYRGSGVIPWQSYPKMIDKRYMKNGRSDTPCS